MLLVLTTPLYASVKVYQYSVSPRLMTTPGDTASFYITGKTDSEITGGQIHTVVTMYGAVIYDTIQTLCSQLDIGHCPIKKDGLLSIHKNVITTNSMPNGWYNIHITVTDQNNNTIVDAKKCFKINNNCRFGILCYL